jgi:hypothetical protein
MWYGDPEMFPALSFSPQSIEEAMWPPHAKSTVELVAVYVTRTVVLRAAPSGDDGPTAGPAVY